MIFHGRINLRLIRRYLTRHSSPGAGGSPIGIIREIAEGSKGNVRAAMADLEMWMG